MFKRIAYASLALLAAVSCGQRGEVRLEKVADALASAQAGDTLRVAAGEYDGILLNWTADNEGAPIVVLAEPGTVVLKGSSHLNIGGSGIEVNGLTFQGSRDGDERSIGAVQFRIGKNLAHNCRLTNCTIDSWNPKDRGIRYDDVLLYGKHNRVDHCVFNGKTNLGLMLCVDLGDTESLQNFHSVDNNIFANRPIYGSNGAETIRCGTSNQAMESSNTLFEDNLFFRCNGEVEVVSIKSSDNIIRRNTFYESQGVLALRHGERNLAENNLFIGNGVRNTGGIRVVGAGHKLIGNTFVGLRGSRFFAPLALMNAVPNSLPNRYMLVEDVLVEGNCWYDCTPIEIGTGKDRERTLAPERITFKDNSYSKPEIELPQAHAEAIEKYGKWNVLDENEGSKIFDAENVELTESIKAEGKFHVGTTADSRLQFFSDKKVDMIVIASGADVVVEGLHFDGAAQPGHKILHWCIASAEKMARPYRLVVRNCTFENFSENGNTVIKGCKNTMAESILIEDCTFRNFSSNGIDFAAEKDDIGRYNAEEITIRNCTFQRILGLGIDIYRGGSDESTGGPKVIIENCSFNDVCNRERGSVIRAIGVQDLTITGCTFTDSGAGGAIIRLDETPWEKIVLEGNKAIRSGRLISNNQKHI